MGRRKIGLPPLWSLERDGVTQGMLANMACTRKLELMYRQGLTPIGFSGALEFGNIFHEALDACYSSFRDDNGYDLAVKAGNFAIGYRENQIRKLLENQGILLGVEEKLEELYGAAEALYAAYCERWRQSDFAGGIKWEALEEVFSVPYTVDGVMFNLRGKIDGRYRGKQGGLMKLETKTKGDINERQIMSTLGYDLQVMFYLINLLRMTGETPSGVLYNIARRPQLRRKKDETIKAFVDRIKEDIQDREDFYFVRFTATFNPKELDAWEQNELIPMLRRFLRWGRDGEHYRYSPACQDRYGSCPFLDLCAEGDLSGLYRREHAFPELVELT